MDNNFCSGDFLSQKTYLGIYEIKLNFESEKDDFCRIFIFSSLKYVHEMAAAESKPVKLKNRKSGLL